MQNSTFTKIKPLLFMLLFALVAIISSQIITEQSFFGAFVTVFTRPGAAVFGMVLIAAPCVLVFGATGILWLSELPSYLAVILLTLINYYKMKINASPFTVGDFSLAGEFNSIVAFALPQMHITVLTVIGILLPAAAMVLPSIWAEKQSKETQILYIATGVMMAVLFTAPYGLKQAARELDAECAGQQERVEKFSVAPGLYAAWASRDEVTEDNSEEAELVLSAEEVSPEAEEESEDETVRPNVIFVVSESFFDTDRLKNVTFSADPEENFHALSKEASTGRFISNAFGGGTGYVEMEMFTGLSAILLKEGDTLVSFRDKTDYEEVPSYLRLLKNVGYKTVFVHSHTTKLFERTENYPAIGFDEIYFSDSFPADAETAGPYISDSAFADMLIEQYEKNVNNGPLFLYGLSMENHQPYNSEKFDFESEIKVTSDVLTEEDIADFEGLIIGLHDADKCLGKLTDYFSRVDEPVMLVFLGDHLPTQTISNDELIYHRLGNCENNNETVKWVGEELKEMLSTDYMIWTNYEAETDIGEQSCTLFGLNLMKLLDVPLDSYFTWLDEKVASEMLIYRPRIFIDESGNCFDTVPEEFEPTLATYKALVNKFFYSN